MTKDEALRLALEALEAHADIGIKADKAITAIKAALANEALERKAENARELGLDYGPLEAKDEPVGVVATDASKTHLYYGPQYLGQKTDTKMVMLFKDLPLGTPVYTTPPQRTWVGLTNDEVNDFAAGCHLGNSVQGAIYKAEAKLKEKNT